MGFGTRMAEIGEVGPGVTGWCGVQWIGGDGVGVGVGRRGGEGGERGWVVDIIYKMSR